MITIGIFLVALALLQDMWLAAMATIGLYMVYRGVFGKSKSKKAKDKDDVIYL